MKFKNVELETVCGITSKLPENTLVEIAFAGRSNVGKSTLLNKIFNRKALARVSAVPGKTATINFYRIAPITFVDLPGYGYAQRSKTEKEKWGKMMENYLAERERLVQTILLVDSRHKPTADDVTMHDYFVQTGCPVVIVANKLDKLKAREIEPNLAQIRETLSLRDDELVIPFSAEKGTGKEQLIAAILDHLND